MRKKKKGEICYRRVKEGRKKWYIFVPGVDLRSIQDEHVSQHKPHLLQLFLPTQKHHQPQNPISNPNFQNPITQNLNSFKISQTQQLHNHNLSFPQEASVANMSEFYQH